MEAATPLPLHSHVRTFGERLLVDGLSIDDECAVRLARERERAGEDPGRLVTDAIEIGARVLDREQTGANADFVRSEFEKAARDLENQFMDRARAVTEHLSAKLDETFSPESGHLTAALDRHFSDGSSTAVQHRVKAALDEVMARSREDLLRQFSSGAENNPLADFKRASLALMKQNADQQHQQLLAMVEKMGALELQVQRLHAERDKQLEVAAAEDRGTAKGRTYEEAVVEALDAIASARGDVCEGVGDVRGTGGKRGDAVVELDACAGPSRGRIVFEAKNSRLSRRAALDELDEALAGRDADYAVFVVPSEDELPAKTQALREFNGDKLFVTYDPEDGGRLALEVAYGLARARVLMKRGAAVGIDPDAVRAETERALGAMEDVRRIKSQLTNASTGIEEARRIVDAMATAVRGHLAQIDVLLAAPDAEG
jgi:hypothetical protein